MVGMKDAGHAVGYSLDLLDQLGVNTVNDAPQHQGSSLSGEDYHYDGGDDQPHYGV